MKLLKFLFKFVGVLGFLLMIFGAAAMDSEEILLPAIMTIGGAGILAFCGWLDEQYVEY